MPPIILTFPLYTLVCSNDVVEPVCLTCTISLKLHSRLITTTGIEY